MPQVEITGTSDVGSVVADDMKKASGALADLEKGGGSATGAMDMLSGAMGALGVGASLAGIIAATEKLYEMGAAASEAGNTLNALTQGGADSYINAVTSASDGMINQFQATTIANKALNAGFFTSAEQLGNVTTAAAQLADVMGVDTVDAENILIDAIDKGNMRLLAQAGIVMKGKDAQAAINALMAADPRLDATSAAQMAAYNAVLAKSAQLTELGVGAQRSAGDSVERLQASVTNLTTQLGKMVSAGLQPAVDGATNLVGGVVAVNDAIATQRQNLMNTTGSFEEYVSIAKTIPGLMGEVSGAGVAGTANLARMRAEWDANREAIVANAGALSMNAREAEALQNIQVQSSTTVADMTARTNELSAAMTTYNEQIQQQAGVQLSLLQNQGQLTDAWTSGQNALSNANLTATQTLDLYQQLGLATGNLTTADIQYAETRREVDNLMTSGLITVQQYAEAINSIQSGTDAATVSTQAHVQAVNSLYNSLISQGVPSMEAWAQAQRDVTATEEGTTQTAAELTQMISDYNTALSQMTQPETVTFTEQGGEDLIQKQATIQAGLDSINSTPVTAYIDSDIAGVQRGVNMAQDVLDSLQDKTITVTVNLVDNTGGQGGAPQGKAVGGPVFAGQGYIVGEKGPEFFMPGSDGTIIPNNQISSMSGASGGSASGGAGAVFYITLPGVTNAAQMFDEVIREGESRGLKFAGVA